MIEVLGQIVEQTRKQWKGAPPDGGTASTSPTSSASPRARPENRMNMGPRFPCQKLPWLRGAKRESTKTPSNTPDDPDVCGEPSGDWSDHPPPKNRPPNERLLDSDRLEHSQVDTNPDVAVSESRSGPVLPKKWGGTGGKKRTRWIFRMIPLKKTVRFSKPVFSVRAC